MATLMEKDAMMEFVKTVGKSLSKIFFVISVILFPIYNYRLLVQAIHILQDTSYNLSTVFP